MTYFEAALQVLRSAGRPLRTREIADLAVSEGLIALAGKTPHASMARVLYLRLGNDPELVKIEEPGNARAKWRSVRWTLRHAAVANPDPDQRHDSDCQSGASSDSSTRRHDAEGMTQYEAALQVLRSAGRPLTTREIADLAVSEGLIVTSGKTLHASMARVLYLRAQSDPELVKVEEPGTASAKGRSVRWTLGHSAPANPEPEHLDPLRT
jgi:ribosomal 50S subunit-recycling heat shock protein